MKKISSLFYAVFEIENDIGIFSKKEVWLWDNIDPNEGEECAVVSWNDKENKHTLVIGIYAKKRKFC